MVPRAQHEDNDPPMPPRAPRHGQVNVYRALLALERRGPLSARDAEALAGLRVSLRLSGGLPDDEAQGTAGAEQVE